MARKTKAQLAEEAAAAEAQGTEEAPEAEAQPERDDTPVNAAGHWVYLRTSPDDPYANSDHLRGFAPGEKIEADNDVLAAQVEQGKENGFVKGKADYDDEQALGYETEPSDRDPIVETMQEAVAAGNASLAPAGGTEDGPPPRGDAPGFGFEGAITTKRVEDPTVARTGSGPQDQKPDAATDPQTTTPGPENPDDLVADEPRE